MEGEEDDEERTSYLLAEESLRRSQHPLRLPKIFLILTTHHTLVLMSYQEHAEGGERDLEDHWWTKVQNTEEQSAIWKISNHTEIFSKEGRVFWKVVEGKKMDV